MATPIALTLDESALLIDESLIEEQRGIDRKVIPGSKSYVLTVNEEEF